MIGAAAGDNVDIADIPDLFICERNTLEGDLSVFDDGIIGILDRFGLLVNLLHHKMLETALFSGFRVPLDLGQFLFDLFLVNVVEGDLACGNLCNFTVADVIDIAGIAKDRRNVGGQIGLTVLNTDDHGAVLAGSEELAGEVAEHEHKRVGTAYAHHGVGNRLERAHLVLLVIIVDKLDSHLGVCLAYEGITFAEKLFLEFLIVFDDSVVDADDRAVIRAVRVGIALGGFSVSRPAGVADSACSDHGLSAIGLLFEYLQSALGFDDRGLRFAVAHRETGRIVSSVFQSGKPVKKNGRCLFCSDITNNSAHNNLHSGALRAMGQQ